MPALRTRRDRLREALARVERGRIELERYLAGRTGRWRVRHLVRPALALLVPATLGVAVAWLVATLLVERSLG